MIELEKLYVCAEKHLTGERQDWVGFAQNFGSTFKAKFALYRPTYEAGVLAWRSMDGLVATTNPKMVEQYIKGKIFELNQIPDDSFNPLEPSKRSDIIPDEVFREIDIVKDYFIPNNIFYMLAVSAILQDDTHLMFVCWRNENEKDFSDLEKQRIALFMRYLATLVMPSKQLVSKKADVSIIDFGEKYKLTKTETEILSDLLLGHSLKMIAEKTNRKYGTVRWHVQNILQKCQVKNQKKLLSDFYALIKR